MTALAVLMLVAAAGFGVSQWLRLPLIPLLMLAGLALSLSGYAREFDYLGSVLELGLVFLVFASGTELNPARFSRHGRAVLLVGFVQFAVIGLCGFGLARALGFPGTESLYVACALSTSSTLVVLRHLRLHQQLFEPFGRLVTGVLLLQDLLVIVVIVVLAGLPEGAPTVWEDLGQLAVLVVVALVAQRWVLPKLLLRRQVEEETLLLIVLAILFGFIGGAFEMGLPTIAGAFLAGVSFSAFPLNGLVRGQLNSLTDFFLALFFTVLGAMVGIPSGTHLLHGLALGLLVFVVTPPLVTLLAELCGFGSRPAIETGLLLAQVSEFSVVLGLTGLLMAEITHDLFSMIALIAVVTMTLTPFVATETITRRLIRLHPLRRRLSTERITEGHVLVLGFGASGMWIIKPLLEAGHRILVVDDDPAVIDQLHRSNVPCLRGDGSDEKVLAKAGARQARLILVGLRRVSEAEKVLMHAKGTPVIVRLFEKHDADRIEGLGGIPIINAFAAADTFMEWFEKTLAKT